MNELSTRAIVPFWHRLREITLYPAKPAALMTVLLLAALRLLAFLPGVGWLVNVAIWVALYKYAFEVLRASADGRLEPPEGSLNVDESLGWGAIRLQIMFIVMNVIALIVLPLPLALMAMVLLAAGLPGAMMSYAIDENFWHALNPVTWLSIMTRIGGAYLLAVVLIALINISAANAQALIGKALPLFIGLPVFYAITHYTVIAAFHLMGYLVYQYHDVLGYVPNGPVALARPADPDQALLDQTAAMVREGNTEAAAALLREHLRERGGTVALHQHYRKLLRVRDDRTELLRHGREWLNILLAQDRDREALDLLRECQELDPAFAPTEAEQITRLAAKAAQLGQVPLALKLVNGFHKRFPKSKDIPANYLLAAKLLAERLGRDAEARTLLAQVKAAYPEHPLAPEITNYLAVLEKLAPAAGKT